MAGVSIQFDENTFGTGGALEKFAATKRQARWIIASHADSQMDISANNFFREGNLPIAPHHCLVIQYGGPTWFETVDEFNKLGYSEIRSAIANAVERGILKVLDSSGGTATAANIRAGTVA